MASASFITAKVSKFTLISRVPKPHYPQPLRIITQINHSMSAARIEGVAETPFYKPSERKGLWLTPRQEVPKTS